MAAWMLFLSLLTSGDPSPHPVSWDHHCPQPPSSPSTLCSGWFGSTSGWMQFHAVWEEEMLLGTSARGPLGVPGR